MATVALVASALCAGGCAGESANGRPVVHSLTFRGVQQVDARDLRHKVGIQSTSWLPFAPKHYLDPFAVDVDRARIEAYYRAHGYFGARVTGSEAKPHKPATAQQTGSVDVVFTVDEGQPTHIQIVDVDGLAPLGLVGQSIVRRLALKSGQIFDHARYLAQKDELAGRLKALGYAWADVIGRVEINRDARRADIYLQVALGPRARFGRTEVTGATVIDTRRVARHANIRRGAPFSLSALEEARGRVYDLRLFSSVKVDYAHDPVHPEVANVTITVSDARFRELRLGGGIGIESFRNDVHLLAIYTRRNFLGGLRTLRLSLQPAYVAIPAVWNLNRSSSRQGPAATAEARFTQPDIFWPLSELRWIVGYDLGIDYAYQFHGPRTQLALSDERWRGRFQYSLSYNLQLLLFFNTDPTILDNPALAGRLFGFVSPYRLGWWQEDAVLDLRDRPLDTHSGAYLGITFEEGGDYAGGAFQYEKLLPDLRGYIPLGSRITLALRVQFGQLFTQGSLGSPITRRFYLGGPNSHRGFTYDRLSLQVSSGLNGVPPIPVGGDQLFLGQAEVRVNLFRLYGSWLALAGFLDAGDVAAPSCLDTTCKIVDPVTHRAVTAPSTVQFNDLHYAVGGGLRYKTVIGTVRFDVGVRLNRLSSFEANGTPNPDPGQRVAFHISVGEAF